LAKPRWGTTVTDWVRGRRLERCRNDLLDPRYARTSIGIVLLPQRDVIYTAKEVASLDLVSNGRVALGVGLGWNREEMRNHGTNPATRGAKMNEQLAALKQIWTDEQAEFRGRFINFAPIFSWPKPVQRPHPPIYIGGESRVALERLRTLGDGWLPQAATPPETLRWVRLWLADNGRTNVPVTIFGAGRDTAALAGYADAEVDEVTFLLPTQPEPEILRNLDELADLASSVS
jgi:probable F420-dependent oxidoreductase